MPEKSYWERRRETREKEMEEKNQSPETSRSELTTEDTSLELSGITTAENSNFSGTRPTKKDSMKENKKYPYKKTRGVKR